MSESINRVQAFIQRAKELSSQPVKSPSHTPTRSITPQKTSFSKPPPVPTNISPLKSARDSTPPGDSYQRNQVKLAKPVPAKRISPQKSITPKSRAAPSFPTKTQPLTPRLSESKGKTMPLESLTEIETLVESLMKTRQNLDEKIKEQQEKEFEVISMIKDSLSKNKAKEEQFDSVQAAEM